MALRCFVEATEDLANLRPILPQLLDGARRQRNAPQRGQTKRRRQAEEKLHAPSETTPAEATSLHAPASAPAPLPFSFPECFKLMNEVENEDLVFTLETLVEKFGEEISPFAVGLTTNLVAAFWKCLESNESAEDEEPAGALASLGCLRAIISILVRALSASLRPGHPSCAAAGPAFPPAQPPPCRRCVWFSISS